ncbi:MAG TPA: sigma-70 family RNA polymerase sigma factor [Planctomycetota bacterium]|nr:sigma-70 family RNA polymerase sigma factor [Planctomycetota bacterium]
MAPSDFHSGEGTESVVRPLDSSSGALSHSSAPGSVIGHALVTPDDVQDAAWVEKAVGGDAQAFESLFLKYRQRVFTVAWRLLRDEDSALDVVQDAFVKAYEQLEKLRGDARFFPWIRRIAINLSIDRLRHLKRGIEVELDEKRMGAGEDAKEEHAGVTVAKSGAESPLQHAELNEFSAAFSEAIMKLSEAHRTVFMLHAAEGMSYKEIAELLNCNMGTVMSRLFYARKKLQELLAPHL